MSNENANDNTSKESPATRGNGIIRSVAMLVAILGGVWAMQNPVNQRINFMEEEIREMKLLMREDDAREKEDQGKFSSIQEKLHTHSTQLIHCKEEHNMLKEKCENLMQECTDLHVQDARMDERLKILERRKIHFLIYIAKLI